MHFVKTAISCFLAIFLYLANEFLYADDLVLMSERIKNLKKVFEMERGI